MDLFLNRIFSGCTNCVVFTI